MQGFDPSDGDNLLMDQSIVVHNDGPDDGDDAGAGYKPPVNLLPPTTDNQEADAADDFGGRERSATLTAAADLQTSPNELGGQE